MAQHRRASLRLCPSLRSREWRMPPPVIPRERAPSQNARTGSNRFSWLDFNPGRCRPSAPASCGRSPSGTPRRMNRSESRPKSSAAFTFLATSMARHSRVYSSLTVSMRKGRLSRVRAWTKASPRTRSLWAGRSRTLESSERHSRRGSPAASVAMGSPREGRSFSRRPLHPPQARPRLLKRGAPAGSADQTRCPRVGRIGLRA